MNNLRILRILGFIEGISYLLLLGVCMPLKYWFDIPEPTRPVGMAHGALFVAYCLWVIICKFQYKWTILKTVLALLASLLPFATFVADAKLFREKKQVVEIS